MIVSFQHRYIFAHAPKTGGTSLARALESKVGKDDILLGDTPKALKRRKRQKGLTASGKLWKHAGLRDIYGLVSQAEIDSFFIFTIVRNPWDRVVSYYFWLRAQKFDHATVTLAKSLPFSEFLRDPETKASFRAAPYSSYVTDVTGNMRCDLFLRQENLASDISALEQNLNLKLPALGQENRSTRDADWRGYYSQADQDIVAEICAADIAQFSYQF